MKTTREEILLQALRMFAERGFDAVSTEMIARALGITKGALYHYFAGKQAIFDAIIDRMFELDAERARESNVPEKEYADDPDAYRQTAPDDLCGFVNGQLDFWCEDSFASLFRRMITIEQFKTPESARLYQDVIGMGPVRYTEDLLREMANRGRLNSTALSLGVRALAMQLFAPLQLAIQLRDGGEDIETLRASLRAITESFITQYINQGEIQ